MKLKNIFISVLAVLVCSACSEDDNSSKKDKADATLSVSVKTVGTAKTKAFHPNDENELDGEAKVNSLAVLIFDENGAELLGYGWLNTTGSEGEATIPNVETKAVKSRIVIVSNVAENTLSNVASYADFESRLAQLSDQSQNNLMMSSPVITTNSTLLVGDNYLGYQSMGTENINGIDSPVEITRLASRIDLVSLKTSFTKEELMNRTVRIDEVTIVNQSTASRYFSTTYWGAVMAKGYLANGPAEVINRNISNGSPINDTPYVHYVMENDASENATQIVVKATLLETDDYEAEVKIFTADINKDGSQKGYDHNYIKRNYVYRLNINFGDTSFDGDHKKPDEPDPTPPDPPTPTEGTLDVQVEVVSWGPVSQDVEI